MTRRPNQTQTRRRAGGGLLALAIGGAAISVRAVALSEVRLLWAVIIVQALAFAAVVGVALLAVPKPGLVRRSRPGP